ncbi:hypothetical protein BT69DRAFT_573741 [Atractiella rhizophila]|nr:hypothetical protein BT69DRAFT_573741 [Atractiella rhizophila]
MMRGTCFGLVVRCNKPAKRVGLRWMSAGREGSEGRYDQSVCCSHVEQHGMPPPLVEIEVDW